MAISFYPHSAGWEGKMVNRRGESYGFQTTSKLCIKAMRLLPWNSRFLGIGGPVMFTAHFYMVKNGFRKVTRQGE